MVEYDILGHGTMLGDRRRMAAYVQAIRVVVRPGAVVVDIGSGTGILALVACQAGAERVYALEAGEIICAAREIAAANGWASRIEFIQAPSTDVELPERADVVVLDVRGVLPDEQPFIAADARRRFLKPKGVMIPALDTVWATLVSTPEVYDLCVAKWSSGEDGIDMRAARPTAARGRYKYRLPAERMLVEPQVLCTCDYSVFEPAEIRATTRWTLERAAVAHGVGAWFESVLAPGVQLSNRPNAPHVLYGQAYFPWVQPIALAEGDQVEVELVGRDLGQGYHLAMGRMCVEHARV